MAFIKPTFDESMRRHITTEKVFPENNFQIRIFRPDEISAAACDVIAYEWLFYKSRCR